MKLKITLTTLLFPLFYSGQTASKTATSNYKKYNYSKVIAELKKNKVKQTTAQLKQLADSYKITGNYLKADSIYVIIIEAQDKEPIDYYNYSQLLKMNEKYDLAQKMLEKYTSYNPEDSRVSLNNINKNYAIELLKDNAQFSVKNLTVNSPEQDFGVVYYKNQIVYTSSKHDINAVYRVWNGNNLPFLDLYIGKEDTVISEISNAKKLSNLNKKFHEGPASYSKDGSIMFYTQDNYSARGTDGARKLELYESKMKDGKWGDKIAFPLNNKEYSCGHPALTTDGNTLYFCSDMPGGKGGVDIYKITRTANGQWGNAENMGDKINTEGNELFPFIHESDLFVFSSDGRPGLGGLDIFTTQLKNDQPTKVINLGTPINGSKDDFSFVLNSRKTKGYFASNREGGKGNDDIYSFNLLKPFYSDLEKFNNCIPYQNKTYTVKIDASKSIDTLGKSFKIKWTFDDGTIDSGFVIKHTFKEPGQHVLKLDAIDATTGRVEIDDAEKTLTIDSVNHIGFRNIDTVTVNTSAQFDATSSYIKDEQLIHYFWKINDSILSIDSSKLTYTFLKLGVNTIKLEVQTQQGQSYCYESSCYIKPTNPTSKTDSNLVDDNLSSVSINKQIITDTLNLRDNKLSTKEKDSNSSSQNTNSSVANNNDLFELKYIYFNFDKHNIRPDAKQELDKNLALLKLHKNVRIEISAHCDARGSKEYNKKLSTQRAQATVSYLIKNGLEKSRITAILKMGETKLTNNCGDDVTCNNSEHQQNRRVEFIIIKMD